MPAVAGMILLLRQSSDVFAVRHEAVPEKPHLVDRHGGYVTGATAGVDQTADQDRPVLRPLVKKWFSTRPPSAMSSRSIFA